MSERQLIDPGEFQKLREIEAGDRFLRLAVIKVLNHLTARSGKGTVRVRERRGPGVGGDEAQAVPHSCASHDLERVGSEISCGRLVVDQPLKLRNRLDGQRYRRDVAGAGKRM